ncbi:hypothetical protein VNO77_36544 [Canavalia gladiata]|uniref:Uncharacterized protein n=1 Tax=Canavalia gladiata TaxID=3824 RepID=A0AAN9K9N1_CANGL
MYRAWRAALQGVQKNLGIVIDNLRRSMRWFGEGRSTFHTIRLGNHREKAELMAKECLSKNWTLMDHDSLARHGASQTEKYLLITESFPNIQRLLFEDLSGVPHFFSSMFTFLL